MHMDKWIFLLHFYQHHSSNSLFLYDIEKKYSDKITQILVILNSDVVESSALHMIKYHCTTPHLLDCMLQKSLKKEQLNDYNYIYLN